MKYWAVFVACSLVFACQASASEDFVSKYLVDYQISDTGQARVVEEVSLTNLVSDAYVTSYELRLQGQAYSQISGFDSRGPLKITSRPDGDGNTVIGVNLSKPVAGRGRTLSFTLTYIATPAAKDGEIWEVTIPGLSSPELMDAYTLRLTVPATFGKPIEILPSPHQIRDRTYVFTRDQLLTTGVNARFGNFLTYGFRLQYRLNNPHPNPATLHISLPSDSETQKMIYSSIEPLPEDVIVDGDGRWLGAFRLSPRSVLDVVASGQVLFQSITASASGWARTDDLVDVSINPGRYIQEQTPQLDVAWQRPRQILPIFPTTTFVQITNNQHRALYDLDLSVMPENLLLLSPSQAKFPVVPPFARLRVPVVFKSPILPDSKSRFMHFSIRDQNVTYNVPAVSYLTGHIFLGFTFALIFLAGVFIGHRAWSLFVQRRRRDGHLRR